MKDENTHATNVATQTTVKLNHWFRLKVKPTTRCVFMPLEVLQAMKKFTGLVRLFVL